MAIQYRMLKDGAFVAGDTVTGRTSYAYPTSEYATNAREKPAETAAEMMKSQPGLDGHWRGTSMEKIVNDYDAGNWLWLHG